MLLRLSACVSDFQNCFTCVPKLLSVIVTSRYTENVHPRKTENGNSFQMRDSHCKGTPHEKDHFNFYLSKTQFCRDQNRRAMRISESTTILQKNKLWNFRVCGTLSRSYTTRSVQDTLSEWTGKLETSSVPEARLSAEHIIAHILGVPRKDLNVLGESHLSKAVASEAERLMTCRLARMPLQYIIGDWDFHSVTIKMRPPVFIPRPETEQLVELALECLRGVHRPKVLDVGCGSGAISLALLKNISDLKCVALDHSKHAIELTEENASLLGVRQRLTLVQGKVTLEGTPSLPFEEFDLVVSNPPYVLRKDLKNVQPEIMIYEDMRALDGGKEGLDVIKPILLHFQALLPVGKYILLEVDPCHQYLIPPWMQKQQGLKIRLSEVLKDFEGKDRFLKFEKVI